VDFYAAAIDASVFSNPALITQPASLQLTG